MAACKNDKWIRNFDVTSPKRHKKGFTVYRVTSVVYPKSAPEATTKVVVWKRFNDFKKLYKFLKQHHKEWGINEDLPKICNERFFNRFDKSLINDRMSFALELLNYIGRHQSLFTSDVFLQFFNDGYQISEPYNSSQKTYDDVNFLDIKTFSSCDGKNEGIHEKKSSNDSICKTYNCSEESTFKCGSPGSISSINSSTSVHSAEENNMILNVASSSDINIEEKFQWGISSEICTQKEEKNFFSDGKILTPIWVMSKNQPFHELQKDILSRSGQESPRSNDFNLDDKKQFSDLGDYLVEAGCRIGQAQKYESEGAFEAAFYLYKSAISCLLRGSEKDENRWRREAVRKKVDQYLHRAKRIYALYVSKGDDTGSYVSQKMDDLKAFKVKKIIDSKVMLVVDTADEKCYVMKVLQKSPCPMDVSKKTIIPYSVPYMVKLHKYFENENSIFLLLQYVRGGKLWDRLCDFSELKRSNGTFYVSHSSEVITKKHRNDEVSKECDDTNAGVTSEDFGSINLLKKHKFMNSNVFEELETDEGYVKVSFKEEKCDPEVMRLVENSQKLLNSVNKTLATSEKLTKNLSKELTDIERLFESNCGLMHDKPDDCRNPKNEQKRSRSANPKSRVEKCFSYEDLSDGKPRTASCSSDRRLEFLKAVSLNLSPRISESIVQNWAAEILVALETLHRHNIVYKDLRPANVLVDDDRGILLTFKALWDGVDSLISEEAVAKLYAAPEASSVFPITPAVDWWSFGALLYELLTGKTLFSCYPGGIWRHTILSFPDFVSQEARSLLSQLLKYEPGERLGSGASGAEDIKCHPFFSNVDWQLIYDIY